MTSCKRSPAILFTKMTTYRSKNIMTIQMHVALVDFGPDLSESGIEIGINPSLRCTEYFPLLKMAGNIEKKLSLARKQKQLGLAR